MLASGRGRSDVKRLMLCDVERFIRLVHGASATDLPPVRPGSPTKWSPVPKKIILDCDPGHDDAVAMLLAHGNPDIELLAVTTVVGNQTLPKVTRNALAVARIAGITGVPFAAGADRPLLRGSRSRATSTARAAWTGRCCPSRRRARRAARGRPDHRDRHGPRARHRHLVPTGGLTNIALAARKEPRIIERVKQVVLMGGGVHIGNLGPVAEFTVVVDPRRVDRLRRRVGRRDGRPRPDAPGPRDPRGRRAHRRRRYRAGRLRRGAAGLLRPDVQGRAGLRRPARARPVRRRLRHRPDDRPRRQGPDPRRDPGHADARHDRRRLPRPGPGGLPHERRTRTRPHPVLGPGRRRPRAHRRDPRHRLDPPRRATTTTTEI